jgi:signal recognition particle subunit SRP19
MRKQDRTIIWPVYFDVAKTRNEGRRVPKNLSVPSPRISEIKEAADKLRLDNELVADVAHPEMSWVKTGMLLVKNKESKDQTIRAIAKQLLKTRGPASTK